MGQLSNHSVKAQLDRLHAWVVRPDQAVPSRQGITTTSPVSQLRQRQRRLPPDRVQELIAAYAEGVSLNDLAERFTIHRSTVLDHLNRSDTRRRYPALDEHGIEVATQLHSHGLSLRDVGIVLGVHGSTIRLALLRTGVKIRNCQGRER